MHEGIRHKLNFGEMNQPLPEALALPYNTYYKPMGDLPYISSEQGSGLIIHHGLIMLITIYKHPIAIQEL